MIDTARTLKEKQRSRKSRQPPRPSSHLFAITFRLCNHKRYFHCCFNGFIGAAYAVEILLVHFIFVLRCCCFHQFRLFWGQACDLHPDLARCRNETRWLLMTLAASLPSHWIYGAYHGIAYKQGWANPSPIPSIPSVLCLESHESHDEIMT